MRFARAALAVIASAMLACVLAACGGAGASAPQTPAYYVFQSYTADGYTVTNPNELFLDRPTTIENWYYLSIELIDEQNGTLCTDGRMAGFTYTYSFGTITLHVPLDLGYDGARFKVGEGTLTSGGLFGSSTVLVQVDEPPKPFA